jgi:hypothetical protein
MSPTPAWERLARRAARREAASRRYFRRTWDKGLENYGAYLRRRKHGEHLVRDYRDMLQRSVVQAASLGVSAETWQDVYYGEIVLHGERPPTSVAKRFSSQAIESQS